MSARVLKGLLPPSQAHVCLSCRRQIVGVEGRWPRRYKHTTQNESNEGTQESELPQEYVGKVGTSTSASRSRIRDIIRGFVHGEGETGGKSRESNGGSTQDLPVLSTAKANVSFLTCSHYYDSRAGLLESLG